MTLKFLPEWKILSQEKPKQEMLLVAFSFKNERYLVGNYNEEVNQKTNDIDAFWTAHTGFVRDCTPDDRWHYIAPVVIKKIYD